MPIGRPWRNCRTCRAHPGGRLYSARVWHAIQLCTLPEHPPLIFLWVIHEWQNTCMACHTLKAAYIHRHLVASYLGLGSSTDFLLTTCRVVCFLFACRSSASAPFGLALALSHTPLLAAILELAVLIRHAGASRLYGMPYTACARHAVATICYLFVHKPFPGIYPAQWPALRLVPIFVSRDFLHPSSQHYCGTFTRGCNVPHRTSGGIYRIEGLTVLQLLPVGCMACHTMGSWRGVNLCRRPYIGTLA